MIKDIYGYLPLIEDFLEEKIPAREFDDKFFEKIGQDEYMYPGEEEVFSDLIDELCYFVDGYTEVEELIGTEEDYYIDENRLRQEVTRIYKEIQKLK